MNRVGLLFPGSMGAAVGAATGAEVLWASEGRSEATAKRAADFRDVGTVEELVRAADIVLSICPPAIAEEVAERVFALGFEGTFVEANAITPERIRRIGALGEGVVDGSIIASKGIHLYLAGRRAEEVAELYEGTDVKAIPLDADIGAASALKMAFGGWNKIGIALTAQAHAIAGAYRVDDRLAAEGVPEDRLPRMADRAWRWAPEMDEIADTCAEIGWPDAIPRAAGSFYDDLSQERV